MDKKEINILVVEDSPSDAELLNEKIRDFRILSCRTTTAASMKDVEKMLEKDCYDAIFLDLNLPDSRGLDTIKKINDKRKNAPIIIMSGTSEQEMILKALNLGVQNYIIKGEETPASLERAIMYSIEREKNIKEIKLIEQKFSGVFFSSPVGTMITRFGDGKIMECNTALERRFGFTRVEIIGRTTVELGIWESAAQRKSIVEKTAAGSPISGIEVSFRSKNGELVPCMYSAALLEINGEKCVISTLVDVSEQRKAEAELKESEEKFRSAFEQAAVGMGFISTEGRFISVNQRFCEITGYIKEEMEKMKFTDIADPDTVEQDIQSTKDLIEGRIDVYKSERRDVRKDKSRVFVDLTVSVVRNPDNTPKYFMAVYEDISVRKHAEEALKTSEEKWAGFSDSVKDIFMIWDSDLKLAAANVSAKLEYSNLTGKKLILGINMADLIKELGIPVNPENGRTVLEKGENYYREEFVLKDGFDQANYYSLNMFKLGEALGFVMQNNTEIKRSEIVLKQSYEKLKDVDRLKSNFISIVSHELRTPLTIIKGFTSFLIKEAAGPLNETQKNFANTIDVNTARLARIINDMVDVSKIESGMFSIEKERKELVGVINEAVQGMTHIVQEKGISLETIIEVKSAPVEIDKGRIIQTLMNLINNAMRFSKKGGVIRVGLKPADSRDIPEPVAGKMKEEKNYYYISVCDDGEGMEKKYLDKIFERFYQVENANVRKHQGAGLGLSIAKNIVEAHDGFIWAESEGPGKGAKICMLLPE